MTAVHPGPTATSTPTPPPLAAWVTVLGGFLTCVSAWLPWAMARTTYRVTYPITGLQIGAGDGIIALTLGAIVIACGVGAVRTTPPRWMRRAPLPLGALTIGMALTEISYFDQHTWQYGPGDQDWAYTRPGTGLVILLIAGAVTFAGGFGRKRR